MLPSAGRALWRAYGRRKYVSQPLCIHRTPGRQECSTQTGDSEEGAESNPYTSAWFRYYRPSPRSCTSSGSNWSSDPIIGAYTPVTKQLWKDRLEQHVGGATQGIPEPQDKAPEVTSVSYNFTSDVEMLEMYRNPWGKVRIGRILEDLDSMAGNIAFRHCEDGEAMTLPPMLVTAAVERIHILRPLQLETDFTLRGQVVYTGSTSLDIRIELLEVGCEAPSLVALFTFVARDPKTHTAARINRLAPHTPQEIAWFEERHAVAVARKAARKQAAKPPMPDPIMSKRDAWAARLQAEANFMQDMPGLAAGDAVLMSQTALSNTFTCQPQQRNMHGRIFGGFLMRRAYELAFATVHMFAGQRPRFVEVDQIDFKQPVEVGDLGTFRSRVLHTRNLFDHPDGPRGQVFVEVETIVVQPENLRSLSTNTFNLTFEVSLSPDNTEPGTGRSLPLKRVLPLSPSETDHVKQFFPSQYNIANDGH